MYETFQPVTTTQYSHFCICYVENVHLLLLYVKAEKETELKIQFQDVTNDCLFHFEFIWRVPYRFEDIGYFYESTCSPITSQLSLLPRSLTLEVSRSQNLTLMIRFGTNSPPRESVCFSQRDPSQSSLPNPFSLIAHVPITLLSL